MTDFIPESKSGNDASDFDARALYDALLDINRLFTNSLEVDLSETLEKLIQILVDHFDLALCWVSRLVAGEHWAVPVVASGPSVGYVEGIQVTDREDLPQGHGPNGVAMRSNKVTRIEVTDERFSPWRARAESFGVGGGMAVPFLFANGDKGVISIYRHSGQSFPPHLDDLLARLGEDLTAFMNHKLQRDLGQRLLGYQRAMGELLGQLLESPDPSSAFPLVTKVLVTESDAIGAWVAVPDGTTLRTVACTCEPAASDLEDVVWEVRSPLEDDGSDLAKSTSSLAYRSRSPIFVGKGYPITLDRLKQLVPALAPVEVASAWPIEVSGSIIAILVIVAKDADYFSGPVASLVTQLVDGIRMAIQNFQSNNQSFQMELLYRALLMEGDLLFSARNEKDFLDSAASSLIDSGLFKTVWLARSDGKSSIKRAAAAGDNVYELDLLPKLAADHGVETVTMKCIRTRDTIYLGDYIDDEMNQWWREMAIRNGWRSSVSVPIMRSGMPWGALSVLSDQVDGFSPQMIALLEQIAQIISHGLKEIDLREELDAERERQTWLASHDILTGLPNRRGLEDRISEAIGRSNRHQTILAVGMLDLDDFKALNDRFGHDVGDQILKDLTGVLRQSLRQTDLLARVGGDEFVVVIEDVKKFSDLSSVLRKLEAALSTPVVLPTGETTSVGGSLGLSLYCNDDSGPDMLLRQADQALYRLKSKKGLRSRNWAFYAPNDPDGISVYPHLSMSSGGTDSHSIFENLLHSHGIRPFYQPIVDLSSGKVVGVEALARLVSSSGAIYFPGEFLGDLSFNDQKYLTFEMLSAVLHDLERLQDEGIEIWCSINVLPELLVSEFFMDELVELVSSKKELASKITFEILEGGNFLSMDDAWQRLITLKELGIDLAIDDIGSAYSSLLRVRDLPIDKIKLDQEFVRTLGRQPNGFHFLNAMSDLSKGLNVEFIAEGVETPEILDALSTMDVTFAQGYAISPPLPLEAFLKWHAIHSESLGDYLDIVRPTTKLGLYAHHIRLTFFHQLRMFSGMRSPNLLECPMTKNLARLNMLGTEVHRAHERYHRAVENFETSSQRRPNPYFREVEESREALRKTLFDSISSETDMEMGN